MKYNQAYSFPQLYRQAIGMRSDYTQAYINRGDILMRLNRSRDAQEQYETALTFEPNFKRS